MRPLGFLSTGFPPIEAHKFWLRGKSGRVQYTRCSLFSHTKASALSSGSAILSLPHARAQGPSISPGPACAPGVLKSSEDLLMKPAGGYPVRPRAPGRPGRGRGVPEKKWWNPPCLPTPLRASAGCSSRGAEASEPAIGDRLLLAPSSTWHINLLLVPLPEILPDFFSRDV